MSIISRVTCFLTFFLVYANAYGKEDCTKETNKQRALECFQAQYKNPQAKIYTKKNLNVIFFGAKDFVRNESSGVRLGLYTYGSDVMTNLDAIDRPNKAVFYFDSQMEGKYSLYIEYAAAESRPVTLRINNSIVLENALADTTGGWNPSQQIFKIQGSVKLKKGKNKLEISRHSVLPSIRNFMLISE